MKVKNLLFGLLLCLLLCGCQRSVDKLIDDCDTTIAKNSEADTGSAGETESHTVKKKKDKELLPDWSNWRDGSLSYSYGGGLNIYTDDGYTIDRVDDVKVIDGKIKIRISYFQNIDDYEYDGNFWAIFFVAVNGKVCDFELDGVKSSHGYVCFEKKLGEEYYEAITISDCDLKEGENKVGVYSVVYYPQLGRTGYIDLIRSFYSDIERSQSEVLTVDAAKLPGVEFRDAVGSCDFVFEKLSFNSSKFCMTIPVNGLQGYEINSAFNFQQANGLNRNTVCVVLRNGMLMPAWDGGELLSLRLSKGQSAFLPISLEIGDGEYVHVTCMTIDLDREMDATSGIRLFYGSAK